jgi:hypothetical protein
MGANFPVKHAGGANLHDFKPQYEGNDAGFKRFHPEVYAASQLIKEEISSLSMDRSLAKRVLPPMPILSDRPSEKEITNYKFWSDMHEGYHNSLNDWFKLAWETLDEIDRQTLMTKANNRGSNILGIKDIFALLTSDTYMNVSAAEAEAQIALIRAPLSRQTTLAVNLETRLSYADDLAKACPARALPDGQLYLYLREACVSEDLRLLPVVQKFVDKPGFDQHTVIPRDFVDFMVAGNVTYMHPPNTGGRAFCDEHGYIPPRAGVGFVASGLSDLSIIGESSPPALGAAASTNHKGGKTISEAEFLEYQRLKAAQPTLPIAIYCFHHGWQLDHVSSGCAHMRGNSAFTDAQRSYDTPSKAYSPTTIDGVKANLSVAPGCRRPKFWKK